MKISGYALLIAGVALAGCAGPSARVPAAGLVASAAPTTSELTGTWRGSYGWPGGSYWPNDGVCTLRIDGDGTFHAVVAPAPGANNLAKASTWSGTAVAVDNHVILRSSRGPSVTLVRDGDRLYGVAKDPIVEVPITISFERDRTAA
jgi:hypothetical protein